jgi:uncharacterized membrane protein YcjF (UPF0283 family)
MKVDRLCAAKKFQYWSTTFNILYYLFATVQTICTVLCAIIYTSQDIPVFGTATIVVGLLVSYTASVISAFLLMVPLKNIYSDCDKASKLLMSSPDKKLDEDVKQLINNIHIPCVPNPIFDCYVENKGMNQIKVAA